MKKNLKFVGLALCTLGMMTSCSNDGVLDGSNADNNQPVTVKLAKAPEINAYVGGINLVTGSRADETTETTPKLVRSLDNVEVNLSVEEHKDYVASHLSIHVRANTDVTVTIPVNLEYICEADDFAIVTSHKESNEITVADGEASRTFEVGEPKIEVKLTVAHNKEEKALVVTTSGISEELIDYLKKTYGDGITFEVWNYTNVLAPEVEGEETVEGDYTGIYDGNFKEDLDKSTISFVTTPSVYVNAFMGTYTADTDEEGNTTYKYDPNTKSNIDCDVTPVNATTDFKNPVVGYFWNNSPWNKIYVKNGVENVEIGQYVPETQE